MGKVEVTILNQSFIFMGDDEDRIRRVAALVNEEINEVTREHKIVNTMNAVIMAMMKIADNYVEVTEKFERIEDKTLRLLRKVEDVEIPCGARDKW
jgi:cell division protein ZapA (FtsZ GTPase activity inhibitor)